MNILQLFDNLWLNSLFGLAILLVLTLINLIMSRKKTLPVLFLDHIFFTALCTVLFGWPNVIYGVICISLIVVKKYRDKYVSDKTDIDYSGTIYSVSRLKNMLLARKTGDIIVGSILPTSHSTIKNNMKPVRVTETVLSGALLVTGSTGSGKSTTMLSIMKQAIEKKKPVVFFDYKGETEILDKIQAFTNKLNIPYYEFSVRGSNFSYDPLVNLNETGKVEAILNTRRWSTDGADEHYKTSMQLAIQQLISSYDKYREEHKDTSNYILGLYKFCGSYKPSINDRDGFNTIIKMLEILLSSRAKDLFNNDKKEFSFQREDNYVICFSFVSANKALANSLSSFVFQDLMDRGTRKHYDPKLLLCVDEFGTLENSSIIKDILEKGRSGGIQTLFSILDINQIAMTTSQYFVNAILGTINSYIFHAGSTRQTAELLSGVQKYSLDFDIMSLQKPYNGHPPTAIFISKYPILRKSGSQEFYKIIPYNYNDSRVKKQITPIYTEPIVIKNDDKEPIEQQIVEEKPKINNYVEPTEEMFTGPVDLDVIDKYL